VAHPGGLNPPTEIIIHQILGVLRRGFFPAYAGVRLLSVVPGLRRFVVLPVSSIPAGVVETAAGHN